MMNPPEEDAPLQEHIDWLYHAYWEMPIILPLMRHIEDVLVWLTNTITDTFQRNKD